MKNAKEMFEELGYELINKEHLIYKKTHKTSSEIIHIAFFDNYKILITKTVGVDELQAINKQCEELNWK